MKILLALLVVTCLSLLAASLALLRVPTARTQTTELPQVAFVEMTEGDVRVKQRQSGTWSDLSVGTYLRPGTLVYVSAGAFVDINFFRDRSRVRYATEGLFAIDEMAPASPKFRKEFLALASSRGGQVPAALGRELGAQFSTVLNHPNAKDRRIKSVKMNHSEGSIAVFKETSQLKFRNRGKIIRYFITGKFALVDIPFAHQRRRDLIFGYLWKGDQRKPVWSGVTRSGFSGLKLSPGAYTFQALTESESAVSDPLKVIVERVSAVNTVNSAFSAALWPDESWENREARIYQ